MVNSMLSFVRAGEALVEMAGASAAASALTRSSAQTHSAHVMDRTPSPHPSPPVGKRVPGGRVRGNPGSRPQGAFNRWRLSMSKLILLIAIGTRRYILANAALA